MLRNDYEEYNIQGKITVYPPLKVDSVFPSEHQISNTKVSIFAIHPPKFQLFSIWPIVSKTSHIAPNFLIFIKKFRVGLLANFAPPKLFFYL
jgi:hypothetical protein